jgi:PTS system mannose-specific IIA component
MIGIVVVTHGRVAEELVGAARTIQGELPGIAAVSIGWGDDAAAASAAIERGIAQAGGEATLILTDMFGGTPTNLSLPMIIKAAGLRDGALVEVARAVRDQGKGAIFVASEILAARKP